MSKIYHIGRALTGRITEGGAARDIAFSRQLEGMVIRVEVGRGSLRDIYSVFKFLLKPIRRSRVIVHYPNIGIHSSDRYLIGRFFRKIYIALIERMACNNILFVDIADMPCEQAYDLQLNNPIHYLEIEQRLFNAAQVLVPASSSMQNLIIKKYPSVLHKKFIVCNNGGEQYLGHPMNEFASLLEFELTKYVYAGTLNKGRGIERLLESFDGSDGALYLLGAGGDWIPERIKKSSNIFYVGELSEPEAFSFVSRCDIGLIPYDSDRSYYNVAYPTKLSFYITAGIPYLSTPVTEAIAIQERYGCGWILPINDWREFINRLDLESLASMKKLAKQKSQLFSWENTLRPLIRYLED